MKAGWFPLVPWGLGIVAASLVGLLVFGLEPLPFGLLLGAGTAALLAGAAIALVATRGPRPFADDEPRVVVDGSWAVVVLCVGLTVGVSGLLAFGVAFAFVGLLLVALGLGGLVREARAERRLLRRARGEAA